MTTVERGGGSSPTTPFTAPPLLEFQEQLGPVARVVGQFTLILSIIYLFQAAGPLLPPPLAYPIFLSGIGVLLLSPGRVTLRMPVSISVLLMIGWMTASIAWTDNAVGTQLNLFRNIPTILGIMIIVGLMDARYIGSALVWAIRISVALSLIVILVDPSTRIHLDAVTGDPSLAGWHALFPHKNIMAPYLVFAIPTVLTFDRSVVMKLATLVGIGVLLVGSDSVTGLFSAVLVFGIWLWLQFFKNLDVRNSSVFTVATLVFGVFTVAAAAASLASLVDASGKDVTFSGRTFIWSATFNAITEQPLIGFGAGGVFGFNPITPRTAEIWRDIGFRVPHAHNGILDIMIQLGVIGAAIYALLWLSVFTGGLRMLNKQPKLAEWIISVTLAQLFISLSENVFLGSGWLAIIVMFRILLIRKHGLDLDDKPRRRNALEVALGGVDRQATGG